MSVLGMAATAWLWGASIVAAALAVAALFAERAVRFRQLPAARLPWVLAAVGGLLVIALWRPAPVVTAHPLTPMAPLMPPPAGIDEAGHGWSPTLAFAEARARLASALQAPRVPAWMDRTAVVGWTSASLAFVLVLGFSAWRLGADRRRWPAAEVGGTSVRLSENFGPALVGWRAPEIVVPRWVLDLPPEDQATIVRHELEHRAAGDHWLLAGALALLAVMPWNVALWWTWRRLRLAIELDCDARVIARGVDRRAYSHLLLAVTARARPRWWAAPAFAERASGLDARVTHLLRPRPQGGFPMRLVPLGVGVLSAVALACSVPAPDRVNGTVTPTADLAANAEQPLVVVDSVPLGLMPARPGAGSTREERAAHDAAMQALLPSRDSIGRVDVLKGGAATAKWGERGAHGVVEIWTKSWVAAHPAAGMALVAPGVNLADDPAHPTPANVVAARWATWMLDGVDLSPASRAAALEIVARYLDQRRALQGAPMLAAWPRGIALEEARRTELLALPMSAAARDRLDAILTADLERQRRVTPAIGELARNLVDNLYRDIDVSRSVAEEAREVTHNFLAMEYAAYVDHPEDAAQRAALAAKRDSRLKALLASDADRARYDRNLASLVH
jgi:hypothetical protein